MDAGGYAFVFAEPLNSHFARVQKRPGHVQTGATVPAEVVFGGAGNGRTFFDQNTD